MTRLCRPLIASFGTGCILIVLAGCPGGSDGPAETDAAGVDVTTAADAAATATDGSPDTDAGPTKVDPGTVDDVAPLPASTFVYSQFVARGDHNVSHLYTFDLQTQQPTLISQLDDDIGRGVRITGLALSPDRRWIAFTAGTFRTTTADLKWGFINPSLWIMKVDGSGLRRVTVPSPIPLNQTGACGATAECTGGALCIQNQCTLMNFVVDYAHPVWALDGQSIFFSDSRFWESIVPPYVYGGSFTVSVPTAGGLQSGPSFPSCEFNAPFALKPDGKTITIDHKTCSSGFREGFHDWNQSDFSYKGILSAAPNLSDWDTTRELLWADNGTKLIFAAEHAVQTTANGQEGRDGIYMFWSDTNEYHVLYEPGSSDYHVVDFAVSKDDDVIFEIIGKGSSPGTHNYALYTFDPSTGQLAALPTTGPSEFPRF